ncbi:hypothetical protein TNCV_2791801 [Trichonephila clavipes]|nr:hypothetical protein TNCV_2791801 [Trichonephila clavipes]
MAPTKEKSKTPLVFQARIKETKADVFFDLILYGKISGTKSTICSKLQKLGWLLSGKSFHSLSERKGVMSLINCHALLDLQNQIAKFWEVESIPDASNLSEKKDQESKEFCLDHTRRNRDGRYVCPKLQNELFNILFRCHRIALTGDIEKMFRQILVNEDDVEFQRIFWREIPEESLKRVSITHCNIWDSLCSIFVH